MKRYEGEGQILYINDTPTQYYINCDDGVIFNANKKVLGYMRDKYVNKVIYIKQGDGKNNHKPYYINRLVCDTYYNKQHDYTKYKIEHIDGKPKNCKVSNLKIILKTDAHKPVKRISLFINDKVYTYTNIQKLLIDHPDIITRYKLNQIKNNGISDITDTIKINYIKY